MTKSAAGSDWSADPVAEDRTVHALRGQGGKSPEVGDNAGARRQFLPHLGFQSAHDEAALEKGEDIEPGQVCTPEAHPVDESPALQPCPADISPREKHKDRVDLEPVRFCPTPRKSDDDTPVPGAEIGRPLAVDEAGQLCDEQGFSRVLGT